MCSLIHRRWLPAEPAGCSIGLATFNSMTIVVPPPGVSSMISSVSHRFEEPSRNRQTQTDPFVLGCVPEPLEGLEHDVTGSGGNARPLVADPQIDPTGHLARR